MLAEYAIVWTSKMSASEMAHMKQTNPAIIGFARLGDRRGFRVLTTQAQAMHDRVRPETAFLPSGPKSQFVAKVAARQKLSLAESPFEEWCFLHNHIVDQAATLAQRQRPDSFWKFLCQTCESGVHKFFLLEACPTTSACQQSGGCEG